MDTFDKAIFDFLSQRTNFEQMLKVYSHFEMVRNQLLSDFWNLVTTQLEQKILAFKDEWFVALDDNIHARWSCIWIGKKEWQTKLDDNTTPVCITWESLTQDIHYGIWINHESKNWNIPAMRAMGKEIAQKMGLGTDNHYWPAKQYYHFNFGNPDSLKNILPDVRDNLAEEFAGYLVEIAEKHEKELDAMVQMRK